MVINHNLAAQYALGKTNSNAANATKSMEKLSSGLRINKAGDDAAGLAISEKMRAQVRGLDQASSNGQDGISMIQTAEGALSETHSILQRMRELAVQSSNDTNVAVDRSEIQKEMDELAKEVTRISNNTEFNTQKLINGGITEDGIGSAVFHIGANANQDITLSINAMDAKSLGISRDVKTATLDGANAAKLATVAADSIDVTKTLNDGKYTVTLAAKDAGATSATNSSGQTISNLVSGTATADTNITLTYTDHGTAASNLGSALTAGAVDMSTATSLKINGATVTLNSVKALGSVADAQTSESDIASALQADINNSLGTNKYNVSFDAAHRLKITSVATGAGTKVDLTGSDAASATKLGLSATSTGKNGTATDGVKDWVATGSLGGVVSGTNNTVNGITIDQTKLPTSAVIGDTISVKGFKDATLSAQLTSVGTGVAATTLTGITQAAADPVVTGTANANTDVTLTYHNAVLADTAASVAVTAGAAGDTLTFGAGAAGSEFNGIQIEMSTTAAAGASPTASWDGANNKITLQLGTTTANNLATNIQTAIQGLGSVTKSDGSTAALGAATVAGAANFATGGVAAAAASNVTATLTGGATALNKGWTMTGSTTGEFDALDDTNNINGLNFNATHAIGASAGDTVEIKATVTTDIGSAVTIDQKNGGKYVLGDATGMGQLKVSVNAGTATAGTSTIDLTTNNATSAVKESSGAMSEAVVTGGLNVSSQSSASAAITTIQSAIEKVSAERSKLGAYQNRLEHTIANLGTSSENLTSAESRIRDVDMAKEMSTYSKNNILAQAAQSMLAQANQQPQQVLQLLQ